MALTVPQHNWGGSTVESQFAGVKLEAFIFDVFPMSRRIERKLSGPGGGSKERQKLRWKTMRFLHSFHLFPYAGVGQ